MANPIVTSLPKYVEQHILPLISKSVLGSKSAGMFNLLTGVKGDTALNLLATDVTLQSAKTCGWNADGTTTLSQRSVKPAYLKVNHNFCDKQLLNTWANYEVKVAAGQKTLPFEEDFVNGIVEQVKEQIEKMIYQGTKAKEDEFEGLISILTDDTTVVKVNKTAGTSAYEAIKAVYASMPEEVVSKDDAVILVSAGIFRQFIQELVSANLYHFEPNDADGEYKLPGTNLRVISVNGLNGVADSDIIIGARLSNLFYATDLQGDEEKFELWYSQDNREFRLVIEFIAGVQYAFGDEIVLGKIAKE